MITKQDRMLLINKIEQFGRENKYPIILGDSGVELINLLKSVGAKNILEVGTCIGYSGCLMLNELHDANLTTIEINKDNALIAKKNFDLLGFSGRVNLILDDAINVLPKLKEKFDCVFLDGPKAQYKTYLPYLINLLNVGGYIFADNVYFKGFVLQDENVFIPRGIRSIVKNLRLFLNLVKSNPNLQVEIKDVGDGICIIKKLRDWIW